MQIVATTPDHPVRPAMFSRQRRAAGNILIRG
jgi:hypothetical protein